MAIASREGNARRVRVVVKFTKIMKARDKAKAQGRATLKARGRFKARVRYVGILVRGTTAHCSYDG